jgi:alkanesulfonate monooxygenase SsuD/methylene tetrahydromethanopterin reductase-like flavin-dependent oxidoreductase (luciferase family)
MRYGLGLANTGAYGDLRVMAELANLAEASGWDGIFLEDYIFHWAGKERTIRGSSLRRWRCEPNASAWASP